MKKIDLHTHTTYSDGIYTPTELLVKANNIGINTLAITDHDCVGAYLEAKKYSGKYNIELVPGIEVSGYYQSFDIHILGYFIDPENKDLVNMLKFVQKERIIRAKKILHNLKKYGIFIKLKELYNYAKNKNLISRAHIANAMLKKGCVKSIAEAFLYYIGNEAPAYEKKATYDPAEIFQIINEAKGASVLAHPGLIKNDFIIPDLVDLGLNGIEVFYNNHSNNQRKLYYQLAERYNLLITGGSDYHGFEAYNKLGNNLLPEKYYDRLKNFCNKI